METRTRSHWAWGFVEKFPDDEARAQLARRVRAVLGGELRLAALPRLEDARLPTPRLAVPAALAAFATDDRTARIHHTYGRGYRDVVRAFRGDFAPAPDLVATPRTEAEVEATLAFCAKHGVAAIPYGGGTSVVAGVEPPGDRPALSLDLRAMDRVLEVDRESRAARIQAGATGPVLEAQLAPHGLTLRHFPQSYELATLGGFIATRSAGHFASLYTHIDGLLESVRMVTPTGVWQSRRLPASGAGPSPDRLVSGSEGILGVITEAWLRLHARPRWKGSAAVHFPEFAAAAAAARDVVQASLWPANCRVLDPAEALLHRVADDGSAVLLLGFESADAEVERSRRRARAGAAARGGACPKGVQRGGGDDSKATDDAAGSWRAAFFEGPYLQSALVSLGVLADTFETACTWAAFPALYETVTGRVQDALSRVCGGGVVTCRFTHVYPDGPAPYFTFVGLAREGAELEQWAELKAAASEALLAAGGTITHHHAVGRTHRPWWERERPEPFAAALRAAKAAVDPAGILNPGVLVDPLPPKDV